MPPEAMTGLNQATERRCRPKICITCSSGGHWVEAERAASLLDCDRYYVTFYTEHLEQECHTKRIYFVTDSKRNPFLILANAWQSLRILLHERPTAILSTGADVTVPRRRRR